MSSLYIPAHVQARLDLEKRREFEAKVLRNVTIEDARAREYTEKLQLVSPDLFMVKANDTIEWGLPLRPGFYHILVRNRDAPMSVMEVHENGRYAEPDSRLFDVLAKGNLRERRVRDELERQERQEHADVEKEREERKQRRLDVAREVVLSATRAQVSMDRTIPWTQSSDGRRGAGRRAAQ